MHLIGYCQVRPNRDIEEEDALKILVPNQCMIVDDRANESMTHPLFFLAGPVRGGGDWQHQMCLLLKKRKLVEDCVIVCPCRWDQGHSLAPHFGGVQENTFARQLDWERHYLELAGLRLKSGCIIFWLGCESKEAPHPGPEPYGMDTRGELGEWRWRMKVENARVVIGADEDFFGLSQIQRNFSQALGYDFPIYQTLEETAKAASMIALGL
jgi:hypothetical protein